MMYYVSMADPQRSHPRRTAFMLSQVGSAVSARFADRTKRLGVTPRQAGVLRLIGHRPGISQRSVADHLGTAPSRVVAVIDDLESRDLVRRTRSATDRRSQELTLTDAGHSTLTDLRTIAEEHEAEVLAGLTPEQSEDLATILTAVLASLDLDTEIHRET